MVATVPAHPTQFVPSTVPNADVLGFTDVNETSKRSINSVAPKVSTLPEAISYVNVPSSVDELNLSHLLHERHALVREVISKYGSM